MKRLTIAACAALFLVSGLNTASASVWTDAISYDGEVDVVQDNSVSLALFDTDGIVNVGDTIGGIIKWNINVSDGVAVGDHAIVVFAAEVIAPGVPSLNLIGGKPTLNFALGAATTPGFTLADLLPSTAAALGGFSPGTLGVMLSGSGTDPSTLPLGTALGLLDGAAYAIDFEFGLVSALDYFEAELRDQNSDGVITIADSDGDGFVDEYDNKVGAGLSAGAPGYIAPGGGKIGQESGGFSVIRDFTGPGASYYQPVFGTDLSGTGRGPFHIVLSDSTSLNQPTAAQAGNGYAFSDQSIILLNAVPEPSSMAIFGLMGVAGVVARRRRKK